MDFKADERMKSNNQRWVSGLDPAPEMGVTVTKFEQIVDHLGLIPQEYLMSAELKAWVVGTSEDAPSLPNYEAHFVPESLLKAWGIKTSWDGDDVTDLEGVPVTQFSEMEAILDIRSAE